MNRSRKLPLALLAVGLLNGTLAQAALYDRGGGLVYDDVLNITWLGDANYAKTSGYDSNGLMTWANAKTWAENLVYHDSVRGVDYSDWRLPGMIDTGRAGCNWAYAGTDCGYNVQTVGNGQVYSELAHMYYNNMGFKGRFSTAGDWQVDSGIFRDGSAQGERSGLGPYNLDPNGAINHLQAYVYWLDTDFGDGSGAAWRFATGWGEQHGNAKASEHFAWAVRTGDVAAVQSPVPEPGSSALLLAGLGVLSLVAKRRRTTRISRR